MSQKTLIIHNLRANSINVGSISTHIYLYYFILFINVAKAFHQLTAPAPTKHKLCF